MDYGYWTPNIITDFRVKTASTKVGKFPVEYTFAIEVPGLLWEDSYIELEIPEQVSITSKGNLSKYCTKDIFEGFTYHTVRCTMDIMTP